MSEFTNRSLVQKRMNEEPARCVEELCVAFEQETIDAIEKALLSVDYKTRQLNALKPCMAALGLDVVAVDMCIEEISKPVIAEVIETPHPDAVEAEPLG